MKKKILILLTVILNINLVISQATWEQLYSNYELNDNNSSSVYSYIEFSPDNDLYLLETEHVDWGDLVVRLKKQVGINWEQLGQDLPRITANNESHLDFVITPSNKIYIGMLQEIFEAKRFIYPHLKTNEPFNPAEVKKNIIQNSIYGVDLEKGAVDIAQLRFWLSLVVDEVNPSPLPNLDYKIMQGNSLLESFEGVDLSKMGKTKSDVQIFEPERDLFGNMKESQMKMTFSKSETTEKIQQG